MNIVHVQGCFRRLWHPSEILYIRAPTITSKFCSDI